MNRRRSPLHWALVAALSLALLWLVTGMVRAGNPLWALATLALGASAIAVYGVARSLAWRYLFPGVVAMVVFIAFPLLYTVQIGFTNYSSNNLLSEARARAYLLDQAEVVEAQTMGYTLHPEGDAVRLVLRPLGLVPETVRDSGCDSASSTSSNTVRAEAKASARRGFTASVIFRTASGERSVGVASGSGTGNAFTSALSAMLLSLCR